MGGLGKTLPKQPQIRLRNKQYIDFKQLFLHAGRTQTSLSGVTMSHPHSLKTTIRHLYEANTDKAARFRYALLGIDLLTILFLIGSSFYHEHEALHYLDIVFGLYILLDLCARFWITRAKLAFSLHPLNIADAVAVISFFAPLLGGGMGFLRALRMLRLLRSYRLVDRLRKDVGYFRRNEEVIMSGTNLLVFIFIMTEIVFVTQAAHNPKVANFLDAMYFTITTLTTTGFGDITLEGQSGRLISIVVMIFGVSLFLRLIQTIFRPRKIRFTCQDCGLFLHENDAVHCKHCGVVLNIPSDGHV
jgi:voltage-gated potassium channel